MGRIKSKLIKRTGRSLILEGNFTGNFEENKKILTGFMPSKKIRNQVAGYITRKKRTETKATKEI
jgi:ribosomal protein S17E